jgi:hypothetical protein
MLFGILLCSLVLLFSTSAKLAAYRHAPAATQIKSMKLPLKSLASLEEAAVHVTVTLPGALLLASILLEVSFVTLVVRRDETLPALDRWFSPALAVRPPPSI